MLIEKNLYAAIGKRIRNFRKQKKLSQAEFAEGIGMERTSVTNIETGNQKITVFALYKICEAFKCELTDLLPDLQEFSSSNISLRSVRAVDVGTKTLAAIRKRTEREI